MSLKVVANCPRCGTRLKQKARDVKRAQAMECSECGLLELSPAQLRKVRAAIQEHGNDLDPPQLKIKF